MNREERRELRERLKSQGPQIDSNAPFPEPKTNQERAVNIRYVTRSAEVHFADLARDLITLQVLVPDYIKRLPAEFLSAFESKPAALVKLSENFSEVSREFLRWRSNESESDASETEIGEPLKDGVHTGQYL